MVPVDHFIMFADGDSVSAIVEHPNNPMITTILLCTAHVRPKDGIHDPSGISVAPKNRPRYLPLAPGPAKATPAITTFSQERPTQPRLSRFTRRGVVNMIKLKHASTKRETPLEEQLKVLDQRIANLQAEMRAGLSRPFGEIWDDLQANAKSRGSLVEKARLEDAGGKIADRLAHRLKKLAEDDGAAMILIP